MRETICISALKQIPAVIAETNPRRRYTLPNRLYPRCHGAEAYENTLLLTTADRNGLRIIVGVRTEQ